MACRERGRDSVSAVAHDVDVAALRNADRGRLAALLQPAR
jgi:hypothetical protein